MLNANPSTWCLGIRNRKGTGSGQAARSEKGPWPGRGTGTRPKIANHRANLAIGSEGIVRVREAEILVSLPTASF